MTRGVEWLLLLAIGAPLVCGAADASKVSFVAVGDVLLDRDIRRTFDENRENGPFPAVKPLIGVADLAFANLECPLTERGSPFPKRFSFRGEPRFADALARAGFDVISVANNHALDWGREGFVETLRNLERTGLIPVGGGSTQSEAGKPVVIERQGVRIGFLASVQMLPEGVPYMEGMPAPALLSRDQIVEAIKAVRSQVDLVVVSLHWGRERKKVPDLNQMMEAHAYVDAGADLILGHHPHVIQPIEIYRGKYIVYSLGNFVFDNYSIDQQQTFIFGCELTKAGVKNAYVLPVTIDKGRPRPASEAEFAAIAGRFESYGAEFQVQYGRHEGLLTLSPLTERSPETSRGECRPARDLFLCVKEKDIELVRGDSTVADAVNLTHYRIADWDMTEEENDAFLFLLLENTDGTKERQIGLVKLDYTSNSFSDKAIDSRRRLAPWKIRACDVDGDAVAEVCVGVYKTSRFDKVQRKRLFVYGRDGVRIFPKWLSSKLAFELEEFEIADVNGDGMAEIVTREIDGNKEPVTMEYTWRKFGVSGRMRNEAE